MNIEDKDISEIQTQTQTQLQVPLDPIEEITRTFSKLGREYTNYLLPTHKLNIPDYPSEIGVRPLMGVDERELSNRVSVLVGKKIPELEVMSDVLNFLFSRLTNIKEYNELFLSDRIYSLFLIARTTLGNIIPVTLEQREYTIDLSEIPVKELDSESLLAEIQEKLSKFPQVKATKINFARANLIVDLKLEVGRETSYNMGIVLPKGKDEVAIGRADYSPLIATVEGKEVDRASRIRVMGILENLPAQYWKAIKTVVDVLSSVGLQLDATIKTREDPTVTLSVADAVGVAISALIA